MTVLPQRILQTTHLFSWAQRYIPQSEAGFRLSDRHLLPLLAAPGLALKEVQWLQDYRLRVCRCAHAGQTAGYVWSTSPELDFRCLVSQWQGNQRKLRTSSRP